MKTRSNRLLLSLFLWRAFCNEALYGIRSQTGSHKTTSKSHKLQKYAEIEGVYYSNNSLTLLDSQRDLEKR